MPGPGTKQPSGRRLALRLVAGTSLLLALWWLVVGISGWSAQAAETNLGAGLLRLQTLDRSQGPAAALLGSSIIAKLDAAAVFHGRDGDALNLGIDGGTALYSAQRLLASDAQPTLVLIEANLLTSSRAGNLTLLDDASRGLMFQAARWVPVLRREFRPSTWFYSLLKTARDAQASSGAASVSLSDVSVSARVPVPATTQDGRQAEEQIAGQWRPILDSLQTAGATVVFVMMPDGDNDLQAGRRIARRLAAERGLPFIDLERGIPGSRLLYSDGTHLLGPSATAVSHLLNRTLQR